MSKERKQRGILATPTGKQKLQEAKANGRNELGKLLTYDNIAEKAVVDKKTVERFMRRLQLIDRDKAYAICTALGLEITDVVDPDEWNYDESSNTEINWTEICQQALINKPLRRFATDEPCELEIFVPLGLVERKKQQRRPLNQEMERNQVYEVEEKEEIKKRIGRSPDVGEAVIMSLVPYPSETNGLVDHYRRILEEAKKKKEGTNE
jgi:predicted transcriptional regulator